MTNIPKYDPLSNTTVYEAIYWSGDIGFSFEKTHKTAVFRNGYVYYYERNS